MKTKKQKTKTKKAKKNEAKEKTVVKQTGVLGYKKGSLADVILSACFADKILAQVTKDVEAEIKKRQELKLTPQQYINYVLSHSSEKKLTEKQAKQIAQLVAVDKS